MPGILQTSSLGPSYAAGAILNPAVYVRQLRLREAIICFRSHSCLGVETELEPRVHLMMEAPDILPPAWNCGWAKADLGRPPFLSLDVPGHHGEWETDVGSLALVL